MQFLSVSLILDLHKMLINEFGGSHGIRDKNLLESALAYPKLRYSIQMERDQYQLAASYGYHIINNHPFVDGNKRIGTLAMLTFLKINGELINIPNNDLYTLAMQIASSKMGEKEITKILKQYSNTSH